MLAAPLLRVRTTRSGSITPLFCTEDKEIALAERLIQEFQAARDKKVRKGELEDRLLTIESENNREFKLVRGLTALLERRCTFGNSTTLTTIWPTTPFNRTASSASIGDPAIVRRSLFEESSKRGFALTELERKDIIDTVASRLHLSTDSTASIMWSDLDHNLILERFDVIDARSLIGWYNLALVQTLLFNCTKLEFSVSGGLNWKRILRSVKRLGLMYYLQKQEGTTNNDRKIVCAIEGPLSLFKMTDRYGTALAKLLPSIVILSKGSQWHIDAWIMRKTMEGQKTLYNFKISDTEAPLLMTDPFYYNNNNEGSGSAEVKLGERAFTKNEDQSSPIRLVQNYFDSIVEEKFARRFESAGIADWKLIREPDPLVVSDGRALIPDFMFEKYGKRVYLEIVGFWTPEYLERKLKKLADVIVSSYNAKSPGEAVDLFIALNRDLACSNAVLSSLSYHLIPEERVILYGNDAVPVRPILEYLKTIDKETMEHNLSNSDLKAHLDHTKDIISTDEIEIIDVGNPRKKANNKKSHVLLPEEVILRIALRDHGDLYVDVAGKYLVSNAKISRLKSLLESVAKFTDACTILTQNGVPESCHAELVSKLGYDVLWQSLDPSSAIITRKES